MDGQDIGMAETRPLDYVLLILLGNIVVLTIDSFAKLVAAECQLAMVACQDSEIKLASIISYHLKSIIINQFLLQR